MEIVNVQLFPANIFQRSKSRQLENFPDTRVEDLLTKFIGAKVHSTLTILVLFKNCLESNVYINTRGRSLIPFKCLEHIGESDDII